MSKIHLKRKNWLKKKFRTKKSLGVLGQLPRLVVFKSNKHFYSQLVDDNNNKTILSASSKDRDFKIDNCKNKIDKIIFDRNGYLYHGRVKAAAEAIREKGIKI